MNVDWFRRLFFGFAVGVASVTPGLSGGVIAAAAGLYEPAIRAVTGLRWEFRKGVAFLLPLALGAGASILLFSHLMKALIEWAPHGVMYAFLGFVAGSAPSLLREANRDGIRKSCFAAFALAFALVLVSGWTLAQTAALGDEPELSVCQTLLGGGVLALGTVIPGISSSFLLMSMGIYEPLISALADFNLPVLAVFGAGFVVTGLAIIKVVELLFRRFRGCCYYAVMGFLLGSMVAAFPGFRSGFGLLADLAVFGIAAAVSLAAMRPKAARFPERARV